MAYHNVSPKVWGDLLFKLCLDESQTHHGLLPSNVEVRCPVLIFTGALS